MCARHSARFIFPYFSDSSDENAPPERFHLRPLPEIWSKCALGTALASFFPISVTPRTKTPPRGVFGFVPFRLVSDNFCLARSFVECEGVLYGVACPPHSHRTLAGSLFRRFAPYIRKLVAVYHQAAEGCTLMRDEIQGRNAPLMISTTAS